MRSRRRQTLVLVSALLALAVFGGMLRSRVLSDPDRWHGQHVLGPAFTGCDVDAAHLVDIQQRYHLDEHFDFSRHIVSFRRRKGLARKSITVVPQPFFAHNTTAVDVTRQHEGVGAGCARPLQVDVPVSGLASTVNASDFVFGISTTYQRLNESRAEIVGDWQYWLTNGRGVSNGAKLSLVLFEATNEELQDAAELLRDAGIDATVDGSEDRDMPVRYINLVPHLYRQEDSRQRKWLVLCDDDTFFPNMHALVQRLNSFDSSKPRYIGTLSEDVEAIERHGSQAFGGAGVFLSMPLAEEITESISSCASLKMVDEAGWQGDKLLRNCIYRNNDTRLLLLPDLWQLDFRGDASGFYEWGTQPLSLHHYRGEWHKARPIEFSKVAYVCGEDCILQRFQTADNFIISGHSIAYYPAGITFDTSQVERTFEALWEKGWNFDFVFGPQRPSLKKSGRKISWEIRGSEVQFDGSVLQTYVRRKDDFRWEGAGKRPMGELDSVIELIWVPSEATA